MESEAKDRLAGKKVGSLNGICMHDEKKQREELIEMLCVEVAKLLCADDVSEEEKLSRIKLAEAILERGEM